jgi:hypothetical protein
MINKLFFENISGLIRIFTNKAVNFKLTIIPTHLNDNNKNIEKIKKNTKITYHFTTNVLNFPNNIKQIYTKFSFLKKNLDYVYLNNQLLNFTLEISDGIAALSESINIPYNDIVNIDSNNKIEKYNSNKNNNEEDDEINELLEFYIKNNKNNSKEEDDDFLLEFE